MQQLLRQIILLGSILTVVNALEKTWNQDVPVPASAAAQAESEAAWRYTKYGWQDMRDWRNVQAEVKPTPPSIHPLAWAFGVLILSLGAMIWIGDEEPDEKPVLAELRRQRILNLLK
jgi:hypothetical protein